MSKISIYGLYNYDETIFDNMMLPEVVNKQELITNICLECGELELVYPDAKVMKIALRTWSQAMIRSWDMEADVLFEEYDPFINIKRDEHRTITQTRDLETTGSNINKVNAWNDTEPVTHDTSSGTGTDTGTVTTEEYFHVEGDSAITDAQDVAKKEIELRVKYNIYQMITNDFKKRFCLMVY